MEERKELDGAQTQGGKKKENLRLAGEWKEGNRMKSEKGKLK